MNMSLDADIRATLIELIKENLDEENMDIPIDDNTNPKDLGLDSLDMAEIYMEIEDLFDIHFPEDRLADTSNFLELVNLVKHYITIS